MRTEFQSVENRLTFKPYLDKVINLAHLLEKKKITRFKSQNCPPLSPAVLLHAVNSRQDPHES